MLSLSPFIQLTSIDRRVFSDLWGTGTDEDCHWREWHKRDDCTEPFLAARPQQVCETVRFQFHHMKRDDDLPRQARDKQRKTERSTRF